MSDEDDPLDECPECEPGLPAWMATFSDLMALLMCFFVLLLSFSELDALKFKRLAGSMRNAFGVQAEIEANQVPKGTSIIAREFSPARPEPTPINAVKQDTITELKDSLEVLAQDTFTMQETAQGDQGQLTRRILVQEQQIQQEVQEDSKRMADALADVIADGMLQIETIDQTIIIRIQEQSFAEGTDYVADEFLPILDRVRDLLLTVPGIITVEGHTDNIPISTARFRSNWLLSAARALSVAEYLWAAPDMSEERFTIIGHGATQPLVNNDSPQGRATNRRVEIVVRRDNPDFADEIAEQANEVDEVEIGDPSLFGLEPDEIF